VRKSARAAACAPARPSDAEASSCGCAGQPLFRVSSGGHPARHVSEAAPHSPYFHPGSGSTAVRREAGRSVQAPVRHARCRTGRPRCSTSGGDPGEPGLAASEHARGRPARLYRIPKNRRSRSARARQRMLRVRCGGSQSARALVRERGLFAARKTSCSLENSVASRNAPRRAPCPTAPREAVRCQALRAINRRPPQQVKAGWRRSFPLLHSHPHRAGLPRPPTPAATNAKSPTCAGPFVWRPSPRACVPRDGHQAA
jgi:hypothetical protein